MVSIDNILPYAVKVSIDGATFSLPGPAPSWPFQREGQQIITAQPIVPPPDGTDVITVTSLADPACTATATGSYFKINEWFQVTLVGTNGVCGGFAPPSVEVIDGLP
jgi:hypothetical protein